MSDLASAHILDLQKLARGGESRVVNLGTGIGTSVFEIVNGVSEIAGRKIPLRMSPRRPGDPPMLAADPSLVREFLGWEAKKKLSQMLETAYDYLSRHT